MTTTPIEGAGAESLVDDAGQAVTENTAATENAEAGDAGNEGAPPEKTYTQADIDRYEKQLKKEQRRINRLTAAKYEAKSQSQLLIERLERLEKSQAEPKNDKPSVDQFQSYDEYSEAMTNWTVDQKLKALSGEKSPTNAAEPPAQEAQWIERRESEVVQQAHQLAEVIPDFMDSIREAADIVDAMPWQTKKALYESEHPALAAYVLEKEGALERLFEMTPQQATHLIAQATQLGIQHIQSQKPKKTATAAPAPITPTKGTPAGGKTPDRMNGKELLTWIRS